MKYAENQRLEYKALDLSCDWRLTYFLLKMNYAYEEHYFYLNGKESVSIFQHYNYRWNMVYCTDPIMSQSWKGILTRMIYRKLMVYIDSRKNDCFVNVHLLQARQYANSVSEAKGEEGTEVAYADICNTCLLW